MLAFYLAWESKWSKNIYRYTIHWHIPSTAFPKYLFLKSVISFRVDALIECWLLTLTYKENGKIYNTWNYLT